MPLWLLEGFDRLAGKFLLYLLAPPLALLRWLWPHPPNDKPKHVFIKMKGGGSLIIAMPSLLGLRQHVPEAETYLVCTSSAQSYAEITGLFDHFLVVDDRNPWCLLTSAWHALTVCFHADLCVDLEPNSLLAAVFTLLTCASQRLGFIKVNQKFKKRAYTNPLSFSSTYPIYSCYDQLIGELGASVASIEECRITLRAQLPSSCFLSTSNPKSHTIGIAAFASHFATQRMMPNKEWARLLKQHYGNKAINVVVFGAPQNKSAATEMIVTLQQALPNLSAQNLCGQLTLGESASIFDRCTEIWAIDTGLLHLIRLLGIPSHSFWGPTLPSSLLRPIPNLQETINYRPFSCSPCIEFGINIGQIPPCRGNNICMSTMADKNPNLNLTWK